MKRHMKHLPHFATNRRGYIAFMSVLVLGAIGMLLSFTLYLTGIHNGQSSLLTIQGAQARNLASLCVEQAIQEIITESTTTTNTLSENNGTCSFTITDGVSPHKNITSTGTLGDTVSRIFVIVNPEQSTSQNTIFIDSWEETQ